MYGSILKVLPKKASESQAFWSCRSSKGYPWLFPVTSKCPGDLLSSGFRIVFVWTLLPPWLHKYGMHALFASRSFLAAITCVVLLFALPARAADQASTARPGGYQFDGTIPRPVLENFLSRSVSMEGLLNGRGDLKDNIRMLKGEGAKYIGRALCLWGAEKDFTNNVERARKQIPELLAADPEMVMEACVFEVVDQRVNQIPIPDWVFTAFSQPATNRNFSYENIIYPARQRRSQSML